MAEKISRISIFQKKESLSNNYILKTQQNITSLSNLPLVETVLS